MSEETPPPPPPYGQQPLPPPPSYAPGNSAPRGGYAAHYQASAPPAPASSNGLAVAAMVTGIGALAICVLGVILGPIAVVLGLRARRRYGGEGMALAGIITGAAGFVLSFAAILLAIPAFLEQRERGQQLTAEMEPVTPREIVEPVETPEPTETEEPVEIVVPAGVDQTGGFVVGMSGVLGVDVPEDAPRVDVYADFMCPACGHFEAVNGQDLNELREQGVIQLYFHPISILDDHWAGEYHSTRMANAVATVADRAPEHFLDFYMAIFEHEPSWGGLTDGQIAAIATDVHVPADVVAVLGDGIHTGWVASATRTAVDDGLAGTPTIMVDGMFVWHSEVPFTEPGALREYLESL